jgi:hypothetical protein
MTTEKGLHQFPPLLLPLRLRKRDVRSQTEEGGTYCHLLIVDEVGAKFIRNVGTYKSHTV